MIHNGYFTHPDLWMMWAVVILTPLNTLGLLIHIFRRRTK